MINQYLQVKVVLIGEAKVGKSSLLARYISNSFGEFGVPTLGVSYLSKTITVSNISLKLNIWDTAGQERFNALTKLYSRDAQIIILVYDITDYRSFEKMKEWYALINQVGFENTVIYAVVGNKEDLVQEEKVDLNEAKRFAGCIGGCYSKTSAKFNIGIDELFIKLSECYIKLHSPSLKDTITLLSTESATKKGCCNK